MKFKLILLCFSLFFIVNLPSKGSPSPLGGEGRGEGEAPSSTPTKVSFFTFGDWGTGDFNQVSVATAVANYCQRPQACDFGLLLGDNFYRKGVESIHDPKWTSHFQNIYQNIPVKFYAVLGNHDYQGNPWAQIEYANLNPKWNMPDRNYRIRFPKGLENPLVEIFAVDSEKFKSQQAAQLQTALQNSKARWKIVATHHPVSSNGKHGDTKKLKKTLLPIICNQADVIFSGHDHIFSHLDGRRQGCGFQQMVVGTGGRKLHEKINPDARALFSTATYGFAAVEATASEFKVRFFDTGLREVYSYSLRK